MARWIAFIVILMSGGISVWWGSSIAHTVPGGPLDFQAVYYGTKCLLEHKNPYNVTELESLYRSEGGEHASDSVQRRQTVIWCINLPCIFLLIAPFAGLPLGGAQILWASLSAIGLLAASFLVWELGAKYAPRLSALLIALFLANCELIFLTGNVVGIVISLCTIAVWCFVKERAVPLGVVFMGLSLAIKPHDVGFIWLYFLLIGGIYRKRALQSLAITTAVAVAGLVWVSSVAPHWIRELSANLAATAMPGGVNSPGPLSMTINILGSIVSFQTVFALIRDDPQFYNPITYLICGAMVVVWCVRTLRLGSSRAQIWLAYAAIAPITMIVTYHRSYDAKLLILAIPACAMLWVRGGIANRMAVAVNLVVFLLTADFPLTVLMIWAKDMHVSQAGLLPKLGTIVLMRPAPLALFGMSLFYLWIYVRRAEPVVSAALETPIAGADALTSGERV